MQDERKIEQLTFEFSNKKGQAGSTAYNIPCLKYWLKVLFLLFLPHLNLDLASLPSNDNIL